LQQVRVKLKHLVFSVFLISGSTLVAADSLSYELKGSFLGVCSQVTQERILYNPYAIHKALMDSIESLGINFTRTGFSWHKIHPSPEAWDWRVPDEVVTSARERGVKILALVGGKPFDLNESPLASLQLWKDFVDSLTIRYVEDIFNWEIWNEPNLRSGKYWPQDALPEEFAEYTIVAAKIIRKNQPDATILLGGLATGKKAKPFQTWESLFDLGVLDFIDGIAYHTYQYTGVALVEFNRSLTSLVEKYASSKKELWITEYGVPAVDSNHHSKFNYDNQQQDILKSALIHWSTGGAKFFIYSLWDKEEANLQYQEKDIRENKQRYYGLLKKDGSPKPAFDAVKWLNTILSEYEPLGLEVDGDNVIITAKNNNGGQLAYFSWGSTSGEELYNSRLDKSLTSMQSPIIIFDIKKVNQSVIKERNDEVLFWH